MNVVVKEGTSDKHKLFFHFDGKNWEKKWEKGEEGTRLFMKNLSEELEPTRNQVLEGKSSPLVYHIQSKLFNISLLSSYTGISKRHIKKHLKPENFNQLDEETLNKYASAFGISVEELKKV